MCFLVSRPIHSTPVEKGPGAQSGSFPTQGSKTSQSHVGTAPPTPLNGPGGEGRGGGEEGDFASFKVNRNSPACWKYDTPT